MAFIFSEDILKPFAPHHCKYSVQGCLYVVLGFQHLVIFSVKHPILRINQYSYLLYLFLVQASTEDPVISACSGLIVALSNFIRHFTYSYQEKRDA
jgi:hypothetical protein